MHLALTDLLLLGTERGLDAVTTNHCVEVMFSKCATQVCKMKFGSLHHYLVCVSI